MSDQLFNVYGECTVYTDGRIVWDPPNADHTRVSRVLLEQLFENYAQAQAGAVTQ